MCGGSSTSTKTTTRRTRQATSKSDKKHWARQNKVAQLADDNYMCSSNYTGPTSVILDREGGSTTSLVLSSFWGHIHGKVCDTSL